MGKVKKFIYDIFNEIGEFFTSIAIVILIMIPFMRYRQYELHRVLMQWLPIQDQSDKEEAAIFLSYSLIAITLVFMVNSSRLFRGSKILLAVTAFILNLFFWSLKEDPNWLFIVFISAIISSLDYGLPHLFDNMWKENRSTKDLKELQKEYRSKSAQLDHVIAELNELQPIVKEYWGIKAKCHCDKCDRTFGTPQARAGHKCKPKKS